MGAVHGVEPARETVVFGLRCFLKKSAFVASIENQKLLHKELNVKLLFKKKNQAAWPRSLVATDKELRTNCPFKSMRSSPLTPGVTTPYRLPTSPFPSNFVPALEACICVVCKPLDIWFGVTTCPTFFSQTLFECLFCSKKCLGIAAANGILQTNLLG